MRNDLLIESPSVIDINKKDKFGSCYLVDKNQPMSIHKAVEQLAYYFKREGAFDFVQYTANEDRHNKNSKAYIWIDTDWDDTFAVGACEFRFLGDVDQIKDWSLQWVWMHPYYRCKGLLTQAWPHFIKQYGKDFHCAPPLSGEMECFLKKMNHKFQHCECPDEKNADVLPTGVQKK